MKEMFTRHGWIDVEIKDNGQLPNNYSYGTYILTSAIIRAIIMVWYKLRRLYCCVIFSVHVCLQFIISLLDTKI